VGALAKSLDQRLDGLAVVEIQGRRNESGGAERGQVHGLAGGGPHLIAAGLKGIGQGATDAAGTTGDQDDALGHDMTRAYCCYAGTGSSPEIGLHLFSSR